MPPGRVWFGVYCQSADGAPRALSFYIDGTEVQRLDAQCHAEQRPLDRQPDAQFTYVAPSGVHRVRVQDDSGAHLSEEEIAISGDTWLRVSHRVVGDAGFMTSMEALYEAPRFAPR